MYWNKTDPLGIRRRSLTAKPSMILEKLIALKMTNLFFLRLQISAFESRESTGLKIQLALESASDDVR
jgi:hypothetical protein